MDRTTAVLLDISSIQEYIFSSNQLLQNIGASEIVQQSTTNWVDEQLRGLQLQSNIRTVTASGLSLNNETLENDKIDVEVVYAGGGNALLFFRRDTDAVAFTKALTRYALINAPGLQLLAVRRAFGPGEFRAAYKALRQSMFHKKNRRRRQVSMLGLGVTATGVYTGLPAAGMDDSAELTGQNYQDNRANQENLPAPVRVSHETAAKLRAEDRAKDRLHDLLKVVRQNDFEFIYDFDQFGEKDESSYIAVIHTDGNAMGARIEALQGASDRAYITALSEFSLSVQVAAEKALNSVAGQLVESFDREKELFGGEIKAKRTKVSKKLMLPFRPLVFGGDDVTFVCDGRLGLALATHYLRNYGAEKLADGKSAYARAGVAIVKTHYPFSRAYALAEDLASRAKGEIEDLRHESAESANVIDWHIAKTGWNYDLDKVVQREYTSRVGNSLLMRPLLISLPGEKSDEWRTWSTLHDLVDAFNNGPEWAGKHNKVLALREALRSGPVEVAHFLVKYRLGGLPAISSQPDMASTGWQGGKCGYYDAVEALEFFVNV
jgi:hypothetical protein